MWEITYKNKTQDLEAWGITGISRSLKNQACDIVKFKSTQDNLLKGIFESNSELTILKDNSIWFQGIITQAPISACSREESLAYSISGPWWYLENLVYQQSWWHVVDPKSEDPELTLKTKGRIILGQNTQGKPISCENQVKDILQYAINAGAPFSIGEIDLDFIIPYDEVKDISCAQAIQRMLRWSPDAVTWFDYSSEEVPVFNAVKRNSLKETQLDTKKSPITFLQATARHDLKVPSVTLKYEKVHKAGKQSWISLETDHYPSNIKKPQFKGLVLTLEMMGSRATLIEQRVKSKEISPTSIDWWIEHMPELEQVTKSSILIKNIERQSNLPYSLQEGSIAPWMKQQAKLERISALVSYTTENSKIVDQEISIDITATDAPTKTYRHMQCAQAPEGTPKGLAKALYDSLCDLQFEGKVTVIGDSLEMGSVINILGGNKEWESMNAIIQKIDEDIETEAVSVFFGPANHLGENDLVQLLRMNRNRKFSDFAQVRSHGILPVHGSVEQGTHSRMHNTGSLGGSFSKLIFKESSGKESKVTIDADQVPQEAEVSLKEEYVCVNGELKKRLVLASDSYEEV